MKAQTLPQNLMPAWSAESTTLQAVERALVELWRESDGMGDRIHEVRTRVMNLITCVSEPGRVDQVLSTIAELPGHHASRSILLVLNPDEAQEAPLKMDARIFSFCSTAAGTSNLVCHEQILLTVSGRVDNLASIAVPLLAPELPEFLWWVGSPPFESEPFLSLAENCDCLVVDSGKFLSPLEDLGKLIRLQSNPNLAFALRDFNWGRLTRWRELLAQFFDPPVPRSHLPHLERANIEYATGKAGAADNPLLAYLMAGWLSSRLGWNGMDFSGRVAVSATVRTDLAPGDLVSVRLDSRSPEGPGAFSITREEDPTLAILQADVPNYPRWQRKTSLETPEEKNLLELELKSVDPDEVFEEALAAAFRLSRESE
ncbi:MAG: glucose-6-phosphate dehydrogenase assembly protein OpcA [Armatimonadetes bacterium]|nr:glucose-6-phosphate dehydrogenase assembly protein OpcA [Armatimonadota bacterium]